MEALQKISDAPLKKCPECGKPKLQKLLSAPSFRLKGGGWYETDFKSGKKKNLADSGKDEKTAAEAKPAKSEPAKPASTKSNNDKPSKGGAKSKAADT
jgi:putative FmdB family regulatory protein